MPKNLVYQAQGKRVKIKIKNFGMCKKTYDLGPLRGLGVTLYEGVVRVRFRIKDSGGDLRRLPQRLRLDGELDIDREPEELPWPCLE